jgi:hypothetical protein
MPRTPNASEASAWRFEERRAGATELRISLDGFAAQALREEAARQDVPVEQLAAYAVSYYLADLDSGRLTRNMPPRPHRG